MIYTSKLTCYDDILITGQKYWHSEDRLEK